MDLLEYQAKELFTEIGIPVLPSQRIDRPTDLKGLSIPYPVVLKSQVPTGGRGRAGGIKFVENTIDAIAAAQTIFHLPIMGEYPQVLLAEARYDAEQEFYLAVTLDYSLRRPVLLGSPQGGIDLELVMRHLQQVVVDQEFTSFYARRLAVQMGLKGGLIQSVSNIIERMYQLFVQKDLDLVEINPLGVNASREVMALDGKISANDNALPRHPDLATLVLNREQGHKKEIKELPSVSLHPSCLIRYFSLLVPQTVEPEGNIAVMCNGRGLTMSTVDSIYQAGGKPGYYLNLGEETPYETGLYLCDRLQRGLEQFASENRVKAILINIIGSVASGDEIISTLENYLQRNSSKSPASRQSNSHTHALSTSTNGRSSHQHPKGDVRPQTTHPLVVVRIISPVLEAAKDRLSALGVHVMDQLDAAVKQTVTLARVANKA